MITSFTPHAEQLESCFRVEAGYSFHNISAPDKGFFLPGATLELYQNLASTGYIRCIGNSAGDILSYIIALPAGSPITANILGNNDRSIITDIDASKKFDEAIWIAKIATHPSAVRKGYAALLYQDMFKVHAQNSFFTATALTPKRNQASEGFHRAQGMKPCGIFIGTPTDEIGQPVNLVWYK